MNDIPLYEIYFRKPRRKDPHIFICFAMVHNQYTLFLNGSSIIKHTSSIMGQRKLYMFHIGNFKVYSV